MVSGVNSTSFRPLSKFKGLLVKPGRRPLRVVGGLFKGLQLELDLKHHTQFYLGLYETETFSVIRKSAKSAAWAVDVGAGAGELSIYFLRQPPCKAVYAFEPQSSEIALFTTNLSLNGLTGDSRLVIQDKFVGPGSATEFVSIDSLAVDLTKPGFIKIDVDGYELDVLDSAQQTLTVGCADVLVEVHSKDLESESIDRLKKFGYQVKVIPNAWWRIFIPELRPIPHNRWIFGVKTR